LFDVGFQEIVLIGIIALLVIGPERLPSVARSVGLWIGKVQRFVAGVKTDIRNELQNETRNEFTRSANLASNSLTEGMSSAVEQVRGAAEAVKDSAVATGGGGSDSSGTSSSGDNADSGDRVSATAEISSDGGNSSVGVESEVKSAASSNPDPVIANTAAADSPAAENPQPPGAETPTDPGSKPV